MEEGNEKGREDSRQEYWVMLNMIPLGRPLGGRRGLVSNSLEVPGI
jgi:hypothetical protein